MVYYDKYKYNYKICKENLIKLTNLRKIEI